MPGVNTNRFSQVDAESSDVTSLMRDINALQGFKADQTLTTALAPQYGIIIGAGSTLTDPLFVDVDSSGNIFVLDSNQVIKFTAAGNYVSAFGTLGTSPGEFQTASGLSIDASNNIWVTDSIRKMVIKFNSSGVYQSEFDVSAIGAPDCIDTPSNGFIYVGCGDDACKYNTSGVLQDSYTLLRSIVDIAVDSAGIVYCTSTLLGSPRVSKIDLDANTETQVGTSGSSPGQYQETRGIDVDVDGNIYVADSSRDKIIIYDSSLSYVTEFGTSGTSPGQLSGPNGLCLISASTLLVCDRSRAKILKYAAGSVVSAIAVNKTLQGIGADGNIYARNSTGSIAGNRLNSDLTTALTYAMGADAVYATADTGGNIYIWAYVGVGRIYKYNSSGVFQTSWATERSGNRIFCDSSDNVWFVGGKTVYKYNSSGVLLLSFSSGSGPFGSTSQGFHYSSSIYIYDQLGGGLQRFNTSGVYQETISITFTPVHIGSDGYLYGYESTGKVVKATLSGTIVSTWFLPSTYLTYSFLASKSTIRYANGYLYTTATNLSGSVFYVIRTSIPSSAFQFVLEIPDGVSSSISAPTDVAPDDTYLHITDTGNHRVLKYAAADGAYDSSFGSSGSGNGQFSSPKGIAKDSSGNIYVVDSGNNRVQKFTSGGVYAAQWGSSGSGNGQFSNPDRIHIDASDNIYVSDKGNHRIQVFNTSGSFLRKFGANGSTNGLLSSPVGVARNPVTGHAYVMNAGNSRIEVFEEFDANTAKYVSRWGSAGSGTTRQFSSPEGLDADSAGHLWVADTGNHRIHRISSHGRSNLVYGSSGSGDGNFSSPSSVRVRGDNLYVVDRGNNRIHRFIITEARATSDQSEFGIHLTKEVNDSRLRSFGTPDRGVQVPALGAYDIGVQSSEVEDAEPLTFAARTFRDMRKAVEQLAASSVFTNPDDGNLYDWTEASTNLYKASMAGRHTSYGVDDAEGTAKRTWTRGALLGKQLTDLDIGELFLTVNKLKAAAWGVLSVTP